MTTLVGVAAETDCCGNIYPLHVPPGSRPSRADGAWFAPTMIVFVARVLWTLALLCAWSVPPIMLRAGRF